MAEGAGVALSGHTHSSCFSHRLLCTTLLTLVSQLPHPSSPTPFLGFPPCLFLQHCASQVWIGPGVMGRPKMWVKPGQGDTEAHCETELLCPLQTIIACAILGAWLFLNYIKIWEVTCLEDCGVCGCLGWGTKLLQAVASQSRADKTTAVLWLQRLRQLWL